ncbi:phloretin 4'-O-glucosyltransferase-like [Gastrolobium bilobum]|uniref:phloretin 4'-O-glucosyltransferase-like n=1 Tax=Gastrolobium bilobum TaxID=150636 RepID=UPI002AAF87CB|nr:phloretin 4'-O-glucosyltransferase-like [Gastrolobium bilobum]
MLHQRILLILYPAQGHINPALQLAKRLIALGAHVTLSTTLHIHRRITNKPTLPGLSFVPFSDGYDGGLTATGDVDYTLYASELKRRGSEFVTNLIASSAEEGNPFTCLVYSLLLNWAAEVARGIHLPTAMLWVQPATVLDISYYYFHGYDDYISEKTKEPSCSIELPGLPLLLAPGDLPSYLLAPNSSVSLSVIVSLFKEQFDELDVETNPTILVNTFEALEPEALRAVDKFNMIPIGPLIPSAFLDGKDATDTSFGGDIFHPSNGYIEWLDSKAVSSVVYVSFGSFCVLSKIQMEELARALLDCGCPFLWVIREKEKKEKEEEGLSCIEELEEKGKIVKWCSQVEVLSHASLGCFVTHCGWNSTMESLVSGVPMVAFPQWLDQKTNAKLIEDVWKIGVRVDHKVNEDGIVQGKEIRECLEVVMGSGEKGNELRRNAKKWKGLAKEAVTEKNLRVFMDTVSGSQ